MNCASGFVRPRRTARRASALAMGLPAQVQDKRQHVCFIENVETRPDSAEIAAIADVGRGPGDPRL